MLGKIGQENELQDMEEGKDACRDYEKNKLKKSKNWEVSSWFWSKVANFSMFLL